MKRYPDFRDSYVVKGKKLEEPDRSLEEMPAQEVNELVRERLKPYQAIQQEEAA